MTTQEYYDLLVQCATDGTFPSVTQARVTCRYRTLDGKHRCAVGVLIPDEDYYGSFEGATVYSLPDELVDRIMPVGMTRFDLVTVQSLHDGMSYNKPWLPAVFVGRLNDLLCFARVNKIDPMSVEPAKEVVAS